MKLFHWPRLCARWCPCPKCKAARRPVDTGSFVTSRGTLNTFDVDPCEQKAPPVDEFEARKRYAYGVFVTEEQWATRREALDSLNGIDVGMGSREDLLDIITN